MNDIVVLTFKKSGLQTSVQDMGRAGYQQFGIPIGGVMDKSSAKIANELVENHPDTPVLEITLIGPEFEIEGDCQMAITGADISLSIDGVEAPMYETISVKSGATLSFDRLESGCRTYVAIRGIWQVKPWLGSSSASSYNKLELTPDSIIKKGSRLIVHIKPHILKKTFPKADIPAFTSSVKIHVLPGPEFEALSDKTLSYFFSHIHCITTNSNRMGYRLDTTIPGFKPGKEIISSGIIPGTIQITGSGQPIILMADAQTTGGYFRLGNVITSDLSRLAQLKPGDEVQFSLLRK